MPAIGTFPDPSGSDDTLAASRKLAQDVHVNAAIAIGIEHADHVVEASVARAVALSRTGTEDTAEQIVQTAALSLWLLPGLTIATQHSAKDTPEATATARLLLLLAATAEQSAEDTT